MRTESRSRYETNQSCWKLFGPVASEVEPS